MDNAPYVSQEAVANHIADRICTWKDYEQNLSEKSYAQLPNFEDGEEPDVLFLTPKEYLSSHNFNPNKRSLVKLITDRRSTSNADGSGPTKLNKMEKKEGVQQGADDGEADNRHIALINIAGQIQSGESEGGNCGSDTVEVRVKIIFGADNMCFVHSMCFVPVLCICQELIRCASASEDVAAIILRIDSPGGDAIASESIWNTVNAASSEKPIVCSMGDICASGGYYIGRGCAHQM